VIRAGKLSFEPDGVSMLKMGRQVEAEILIMAASRPTKIRAIELNLSLLVVVERHDRCFEIVI
jgi:hypothetical protein